MQLNLVCTFEQKKIPSNFYIQIHVQFFLKNQSIITCSYLNFCIRATQKLKSLLGQSQKSGINNNLVPFSGKLTQHPGQDTCSNLVCFARSQNELLHIIKNVISRMDLCQTIVTILSNWLTTGWGWTNTFFLEINI